MKRRKGEEVIEGSILYYIIGNARRISSYVRCFIIIIINFVNSKTRRNKEKKKNED